LDACDAFMSVKMGIFRDFRPYTLDSWRKSAVLPTDEPSSSRMGAAIGIFEDDHRFTIRLRLMM
jgi:hypothetical protein